MRPNAGWGRGVAGVSANEYSCAHGAQINFGDLTPYLTYAFSEHTVPPRKLAYASTHSSYDFRKYSEQVVMNMDWKNCSHVFRSCPVNTDSSWEVVARHIPGSPGWAPVCPTAGSSRGRTCWRGGSPSSATPSQISWSQISWSLFPQLISPSRWHYSLLIIGSRPALPHWFTKQAFFRLPVDYSSAT